MTKMDKVVIIGRGFVAKSLLIHSINSKITNKIKIAGVITYSKNHLGIIDSGIIEVAKYAGIEVFDGNVNSTAALDWLDTIKPTYGFMAQFIPKLSTDFLGKFKGAIINGHPSKLPYNRGGYPIHKAIMEGDRLVITAHVVDVKYDHGPIIHQTHPIEITGLSISSIFQLLGSQIPIAIEEAYLKLIKNPSALIEQDNLKATYATKKVFDKLIKFDWKTVGLQQAYRKILCYSYEGLSVHAVAGKSKIPFQIYSGYPLKKEYSEVPGSLKVLDDKLLIISCKGGCLIIDNFKSEEGLLEFLSTKNAFIEG